MSAVASVPAQQRQPTDQAEPDATRSHGPALAEQPGVETDCNVDQGLDQSGRKKMETDMNEHHAGRPERGRHTAAAEETVAPPDVRLASMVLPQAGCASCGGTGAPADPGQDGGPSLSYIYAIGRIEARFPNLAAEKEFAQATGRTETAGRTDRQAFHAVLSQRENRYLARQLCWVLTIQGLESYLLVPRDPSDLDLLVESIRPIPGSDDIDVVIGMRGPIASPTLCNGLMVPIVAFEQVYSFNRDALIKAIPKPERASTTQFAAAAEELFNRIMQMTDNAGATDEHRALNYLAMRYPDFYGKAAEEFERDRSLTGVDVRPSPLSSTRKIVDVICAYTHRATDFTEKYSVRVDVTEQFPFLVKKMSPYYDREIGGAR